MLQSKTSRPPVQQLRPDIPISAQHDSPCTNTHTAAHTRCWKKKKKKRRRRWHSPGRPPNHQAGRGGRGWLQESAINIWHLCYFMCGICESDQRVKKKKKKKERKKKKAWFYSVYSCRNVCVWQREKEMVAVSLLCVSLQLRFAVIWADRQVSLPMSQALWGSELTGGAQTSLAGQLPFPRQHLEDASATQLLLHTS